MIQPMSPAACRILVICVGNHCRSPLGEAILAHRGGTAVDMRSAGLVANHVSQPAHPLMIAAGQRLGYDLTPHRGRHLTPELLDWADLILVMDRDIGRQVEDLTTASTRAKIELYLPEVDVPDPWGKTADDFAACAALIAAGADQRLP